jgi:CBS domain-containing protein
MSSSNIAVQSQISRMTVGAVMEREVTTASPQAKGSAIARLMLEGFGGVPIVDAQRRLVGVVTEHDLLTVIDRGTSLDGITAEDIMSRNPYSLPPESSVGTLVHVFRASGLIRAPVVDATGVLVGIVARRDILRLYVEAAEKPTS